VTKSCALGRTPPSFPSRFACQSFGSG
jgi:hypothetical protein